MGPLIADGSAAQCSAPIPSHQMHSSPFRYSARFYAPTVLSWHQLLLCRITRWEGNSGILGEKPTCLVLSSFLSLSLSLSALSSCRRAQENDDYKPLGLGVRLPRFCIKVDSNPSEIFSLSKLPLPRRITRPGSSFDAFSGSTELRTRMTYEEEEVSPGNGGRGIFFQLSDRLWTLGILWDTSWRKREWMVRLY